MQFSSQQWGAAHEGSAGGTGECGNPSPADTGKLPHAMAAQRQAWYETRRREGSCSILACLWACLHVQQLARQLQLPKNSVRLLHQ